VSGSSVKSSGFWVASASEVRRHYRKSVNDIVLSTPVAGRLLNISEAGMGVETRSPLSVRTRSVFVLESGTSRRTFEGEVRWCRLTDTIPLSHGESTSVYRAGIAFVTA
jgi:hypothetical protein